MYGFKYIEGFDPLLTDESNPSKAGSISMEEPEYNPPFTHQEKYSVISNPSKAGSIYTPFFKEDPIIQRKETKQKNKISYEKLREASPLSVNLPTFISYKMPESKKKGVDK